MKDFKINEKNFFSLCESTKVTASGDLSVMATGMVWFFEEPDSVNGFVLSMLTWITTGAVPFGGGLYFVRVDMPGEFFSMNAGKQSG